MNWRIFITAFVSIAAISFPANIIGCGPEADPYDYYTSFFHQQLPDATGYKPFYYTGYNFLYDVTEKNDATDQLAKEWAAYCGTPVTETDAKDFVMAFTSEQVDSLQTEINRNRNLSPKNFEQQNSMRKYFLLHDDQEALQYIQYAKKVQPYVIGDESSWEPIQRDSIGMDQMIKEGQGLFKTAKKDFIKLKYGYQLVRLAHYSKRYGDAIKWYDEYVADNKSKTILQSLSLALKAGALYHIGEQKKAAILFSKVFTETDINRVSNYLSFLWSRSIGIDRQAYLDLCKNDHERVSMLILFALAGGTDSEISTIQKIYQLDPLNKALEVLVVREINKLEENYLTPMLHNQKGGTTFYLNYGWYENQANQTKKQQVNELAVFLDSAAKSNNVSNQGLFETGAAYLYLMANDYQSATRCVEATNKMKLTQKVKDQLSLTNLLLTINAKDTIDAAFENQLLPSIKWLQQKAEKEDAVKVDYSEIRQWRTFYRNLMSEVLAKRYHAQGELYKEALVIGAADRIYNNTQANTYLMSIEFLHNEMESKDVEKLYALQTSNNKTGYDNYLIKFSAITKADVTDFMGTVYLREYNYATAIKWFNKTKKNEKDPIKTNPFIELLYDQESDLPGEVFKTTKLDFAKEMRRLENLLNTDKSNASKYYYKMALGMYNITYYGHAWQLVQYWRTSTDGYSIPKDANAFQKEYYGCFKAHDYFKKAMNASPDKNFKAKCLFMMARCAQKQLQQPQYKDFPETDYNKGNDYSKYNAAADKYRNQFVNNKYFPQFVKEYKNTSFYKEAYNSCSYLRDFVKRKK